MKRIDRKRRTLCFHIRDAHGEALYDGPLEKLDFADELIREMSDEFFGDPEPCYIHQGAIMARIVGELAMKLPPNQSVSCKELPPELRRYLSRYDAASVCLEVVER